MISGEMFSSELLDVSATLLDLATFDLWPRVECLCSKLSQEQSAAAVSSVAAYRS
jgi:hypothetical protein